MNTKIVAKKVTKLSFNQLEPGEIEQDSQVHINIGTDIYANSNNKNLFRIKYPINLIVRDIINISIDYDFDFLIDEEVTPSILGSELVSSKTPSLAYPYIKTYLENLITLSGYPNINIPYINFFETPLDIKIKK